MKPGAREVGAHPFACELRAVLERRGDELARRGRRYLMSVGYRTEDGQRRAARRLLGLDPTPHGHDGTRGRIVRRLP